MPWLDQAGQDDRRAVQRWRLRPVAGERLAVPADVLHASTCPRHRPALGVATPPAFTAGPASAGLRGGRSRSVSSTPGARGSPFGDADRRRRAPCSTSPRSMPAGRHRRGAEPDDRSIRRDGWVRAFPCDSPEPPTSNVNPARRPCRDQRGDRADRRRSHLLHVAGDHRSDRRSERLADDRRPRRAWSRSTDASSTPAPVIGGVSRLATVARSRWRSPRRIRRPRRWRWASRRSIRRWTGSSPRGRAATAQPTVSNLNPEAGVTRPNLVNVRVGAGGKVCLYSLRADRSGRRPAGRVPHRRGRPLRGGHAAAPAGLASSMGTVPIMSNLSDVIPLGSVAAAQVNLTATDTSGAGLPRRRTRA